MRFPYRRIFLVCADPAEIFLKADTERLSGPGSASETEDPNGRESMEKTEHSCGSGRPDEALQIPNLRRLGLANFMRFRTAGPCKAPAGRYIALPGNTAGCGPENGFREMMGAAGTGASCPGTAGHPGSRNPEDTARRTALEALAAHGEDVICIGRVADFFGGQGITVRVKADNWEAAMDEALRMTDRPFAGLCLVDVCFADAGSGGMVPGAAGSGEMDPGAAGLGNAGTAETLRTVAETVERFDMKIGQLFDRLTGRDLLLFTAVRGSGAFAGDLPLIGWSPNLTNGTGGRLPGAATPGVIGASVCANFGAEYPVTYAERSRIEDFR